MHWTLTSHACAACYGRVLLSADGDEACCADCGATGHDVTDICACGADGIGQSRLRCVPNVSGRPLGSPVVVVEISTHAR